MEFDRKTIIFVLLFVFALRYYLYGRNDPAVHKGHLYAVSIPEGWEKKTQEDEVIFESPDIDYMTDQPEANISIYAKKLAGTVVLFDVAYPEIVEAVVKSGWAILDRGEIKIDEEIFKWMLCRPQDPDLPEMLLSFYRIDDFNNIMRIQFLTNTGASFNKHRETFEKMKASIKIKKMF